MKAIVNMACGLANRMFQYSYYLYLKKLDWDVSIDYYCCPLKVSEQRDIHPQCCCNGIADDFSEGKPLS